MSGPSSVVDDGHVVVVDDDKALLRVVQMALESRGHRVSTATTGTAALDLIGLDEPDVVILDLGLPDMDGIDVGQHLRRWSKASILVLSADGAEDRKVRALNGTADDYLTKPFSMPELMARVGVALRHRRALASIVDDAVIELGSLQLDLTGHAARIDGNDLDLTPKEFKLLTLLARNAGKVLTHRTILDAVWGPTQALDTLRTHVSQLRRKLGAGEHAPQLLTEAGVGYRLLPPEGS
jgi:two-component system KDP operon response regulator KdpE